MYTTLTCLKEGQDKKCTDEINPKHVYSKSKLF